MGAETDLAAPFSIERSTGSGALVRQGQAGVTSASAMSRDDLLARQVLRWGSSPSEDRTGVDFLQSRELTYLGLLAGFFGALYLIAALLLYGYLSPEEWLAVHLHPSKLVHLGAVVLPLGMWAWIRRGPRSLRALRTADFASTFTLGVATGLGIYWAPAGFHFELAGLLILVLTLVLRAALVPSTPRFTALVGTISFPPLIVGGYLQSLKSGQVGLFTPTMLLIGALAWLTASTAVTVVVSHVIYGLVRQVREAMRLGQYTLGEKIGEGGMGAVYRAQHGLLRRATAVKLLLPERMDPDAVLRFEREVRLTSQLSHPNTVAIYDYGRTPEGTFFYAMEYLEGVSLEQLVEDEGPQPAGRVVHILRQIAGSLREAHEAGLIHRDIKPSNVLLCTRGGISEFVKVIDFGLVKHIESGERLQLTQANAIAGTPLFMAPESITAPDTVGAAIDTYALGAVAFYLLTGTPPFEGRSAVEVCSHHLHTPPVPPSERLGAPVPAQLEALVLACLAKDPAVRPSDAELMRALAACQAESIWALNDSSWQA